MVSIKHFKELALSFPETVEQPHFEKTSFRFRKKIFATLSEETSLAVIKLSAVDQSVFSSFDKTIIYPVENKWGKQGWTAINLKKARKNMLKDALTTAYNQVANIKTQRDNV